LLIIQLTIVNIKYWYTVVFEIYSKFTRVERDVSSDIVLITGKVFIIILPRYL
jgi:hypothetical protein